MHGGRGQRLRDRVRRLPARRVEGAQDINAPAADTTAPGTPWWTEVDSVPAVIAAEKPSAAFAVAPVACRPASSWRVPNRDDRPGTDLSRGADSRTLTAISTATCGRCR